MKRRILIASWIVLFILAVSAAGYFYFKYQSVQKKSFSANQEVQDVLAAVAKLMILPDGETPTVASVTDADKLKDQPFFTSAQNGDKVLIYSGAKKAILYRPALGKIIDVAPVSVGSPSATPVTAEIRFVLYNGTTTTGLTKKYEIELKTKVQGAAVVDRDNAKNSDYEKSVLVDISGTKSAAASELAKTLGLTVSLLPQGEATPEADFLIILGTDKK